MDLELYQTFFKLEDRHWWFTARQRILADVLAHSISLPKTAKVLDVGCGTGAFLKMLSMSFDAFGTDTSPLAIDFCRQRGIQQAYCCTLDTFPRPELRFDLISMLDVLEHIENDSGALDQAFHYLKPNGILLVTVPAYMFLWSHHDIVNHHQRRYTRNDLKKKLLRNEFIIDKITYFNTFLFPAAAIVRTLQSFSKTQNDALLTMPSPAVNTMLHTVFAAERKFLRWMTFPYGLSLLALARKP